jgi:2-iminobutanoate/2-iminopropanoate deaminase
MRRLVALTLLAFPITACAARSTTGASSSNRPVTREVVAPAGASTVAPYSPAIRSGDFLFISGQVGLKPGTRELAAGGITAETTQALENVRTILTAAGLKPSDVVRCNVFLADIRDYDAMNAVYGPFFGAAPPARSAFAVAGLPVGARVEIECTARARS